MQKKSNCTWKRTRKKRNSFSADLGDEMKSAIAEGLGGYAECMSVEEFLEKAKALKRVANERKMYSFRLKVSVVDRIKEKAAAAGIPYQTYVGALLEKSVV